MSENETDGIDVTCNRVNKKDARRVFISVFKKMPFEVMCTIFEYAEAYYGNECPENNPEGRKMSETIEPLNKLIDDFKWGNYGRK